MNELALRSRHELSGAVFRNDGNWSVVASYGSVDSEVRAVRTRAGVIDLSDCAKIELTGSERVTFLDGLVTADMKILAPGSSAYALLLNEKSRVLGDLRAYAFPESLVLDIEARQKDSVLRILEKGRVSDDVEFRDLGPAAHFVVLGRASETVVAGVFGPDVRNVGADGFLTVPVGRHHRANVARIRTNGEAGFAIWSADSDLVETWTALLRWDAVPIGRDAFEILRIEAGVPRFGVDMGEDTLALEAAPESAISFTKGCYVGQEIVARGTYVGQVRRKLLGLRVDGDVTPVRGDRVSKGERDVGFVTSGAWSPTLGSFIAMGVLRTEDATPEDGLFVDRGGWALRARLRPLPFVTGSA